MPKLWKASAYEGAVQQDCEKLLLAAAADRLFDIQAFMFRFICDFNELTGMLTRNRFARGDVHTHL
jgi:hypothetical protein